MRLTDFDWPEIVLDLRRAGMAQHEVARALGPAAGESMVRQYLAGATPAHWRGELLLALWEEKTGRVRAAAPRRPAEARRAPERRRRMSGTAQMPAEQLLAVARAYNMSVTTLTHLLNRGRRQSQARAHNLSLPGFED